jgi:NADPH:quinone reductase-like Zn-dependent oxidoreductase
MLIFMLVQQDWGTALAGKNMDMILEATKDNEGDYKKAKAVLKKGGAFVTLTAGMGPAKNDGEHVFAPFFTTSNHAQLDALRTLVEQGVIVPGVDKVFSLDKAGEALQYLGGGKAQGKIVVNVAGHVPEHGIVAGAAAAAAATVAAGESKSNSETKRDAAAGSEDASLMKAALVSDYGADKFSVSASAKRPVLDANSDKVLIKVEACSLNPIDIIVQMGMFCVPARVRERLDSSSSWPMD